MNKWESTTVGDFCPFLYGKGLKETERNMFGQFNVFGSNGIVGKHDKPLIETRGVIIGRKGSVGAVHFSNKPFWPIDTTFYVAESPNNEIRYIYYLLKSLGLEHMNSDSAVPGLNRDAAHAREIFAPPIPEQRAIAEVLGALDDKIELNRRMNETLEQLARALFKSWFVDFVPVRAKAAGRAPAGMDADTAALFPSAFDGDVPQGWRVEEIGNAVKVVGGSTPSTKNPEYWEGEYHWATPKDLSALQSPILLDTERKITKAGVSQISSGILPAGTLLMSSRAPVGYLAISEIPVSINQGFIAMICDGDLPNYYVLHWAQTNMEAIQGRANGTTFMEISKSNFRPMSVIVPSSQVLQKFVEQVEPLYKKISANLQQSRTLAALRDALLPRLMSGEIRVKVE